MKGHTDNPEVHAREHFPLRARVRRWWQSWRIPRAGRSWLLAAVILWATGLYKGINLITLMATLMVVIWGLNFLLAGLRLRGLRLSSRIEEPIFAEKPFTVSVEVDNPQARDVLGGRLSWRGAHHHLVWFLFRIAGGEKKLLHHALTLPRRGRYSWPPLRLTNGFPFGLIERFCLVGGNQEMIVLPALGQLHRGRFRRFLFQGSPSLGRARGRPCRHPSAQSEFHSLRAFRTGDSPRLIHWRTSARRGEWMVREFEETPNDNLVLVLDPGLPSEADPAGNGSDSGEETTKALFEEAVSLAATICWEWCRQHGDRFVLALADPIPRVFDGITGREHALEMLRALALVSLPSTPCRDALADRLAAAALPPGPLLVVSPRPSPLADHLAARLHRPAAGLDVSSSGDYDFFERALAHAS